MSSAVVSRTQTKKNPLFSKDVENFLLQNIGMLEKFSETDKTFWGIREAGESFIK